MRISIRMNYPDGSSIIHRTECEQVEYKKSGCSIKGISKNARESLDKARERGAVLYIKVLDY